MRSEGDVVVIGGLNIDTLARISGDTVPGSSNPGVTGTAHGGVGRNVAENLARLGSPVRLIGVVGDDASGAALLAQLELVDVDVRGVRRSADCATGTYTAVLDRDGGLVVGVADMAAADLLAPEDIGEHTLLDASWLVLDGNLRTDTIARCLALAEEDHVPVVLDPVGVTKATRLGRLPGLHTFTPNHDELLAWLIERADALHARLETEDPATKVWTWSSGDDIAWIARRMAHESAVHRVDAEAATGVDFRIAPALAADGTDEFLTYFLGDRFADPPQAVALGGSVHLHCTDTDGEWTVVDGAPGQYVVAREHAREKAKMPENF